MSTTSFAIALQTRLPVLVWGDPGVGKTRYTESLARVLGAHLETVIASIHEPQDFSGLPVLTNGDVKSLELAPPGWAKRLVEQGGGILFLDELPHAPPATQAALLRVVLDKVVGNLPLPERTMIAAAANPTEQAGGWDLPAPMANRFIHLEWTVDTTAWINGMLQGWPDPTIPILPENWTASIHEGRTLVASFIRTRPELLLRVPDATSEASKAWPSPRSWDNAGIVLAAVRSVGGNEEVEIETVSGAIGNGPALELFSYLQNLDLPDPEKLLKTPSKFKLPERGDIRFAVLASVASAAVRNLTGDRWLAAWEIMARAVEQGSPDIAAGAANVLLTNRRGDLPKPKAAIVKFLPILQAAGVIKAKEAS